MSNLAQGWAWQQSIPTTDKFILVALADHADDTGICWPGLKGIAEKCGVTRRTVSNVISRLTVSGHIAVEPRFRPDGSRTSNQYLLLLRSIPLEPNDTTPWKQTAVGTEPEGETRTPIETPVNPQGTSIEELQEKSDSETWPEWFSLGHGLKGWTVDLNVAEDWARKHSFTEKYLLDKIYVVRSQWDKEKEKKGRDPYATFQRACRENWGASPLKGDGRATRAGNISTNPEDFRGAFG